MAVMGQHYRTLSRRCNAILSVWLVNLWMLITTSVCAPPTHGGDDLQHRLSVKVEIAKQVSFQHFLQLIAQHIPVVAGVATDMREAKFGRIEGMSLREVLDKAGQAFEFIWSIRSRMLVITPKKFIRRRSIAWTAPGEGFMWRIPYIPQDLPHHVRSAYHVLKWLAEWQRDVSWLTVGPIVLRNVDGDSWVNLTNYITAPTAVQLLRAVNSQDALLPLVGLHFIPQVTARVKDKTLTFSLREPWSYRYVPVRQISQGRFVWCRQERSNAPARKVSELLSVEERKGFLQLAIPAIRESLFHDILCSKKHVNLHEAKQATLQKWVAQVAAPQKVICTAQIRKRMAFISAGEFSKGVLMENILIATYSMLRVLHSYEGREVLSIAEFGPPPIGMRKDLIRKLAQHLLRPLVESLSWSEGDFPVSGAWFIEGQTHKFSALPKAVQVFIARRFIQATRMTTDTEPWGGWEVDEQLVKRTIQQLVQEDAVISPECAFSLSIGWYKIREEQPYFWDCIYECQITF